MTMEEAIKHAEEVANKCDMLAEQSVVEQAEHHHHKCAAEHRQLAEWLRELKQLKEQRRWIPCSERLPKEFEFVNCTCHSLIDDREDWVVETVYIPQPSDSPYSDWGNIPMLNSGDCEVVAWVHRYIPKPYKAEMESEE